MSKKLIHQGNLISVFKQKIDLPEGKHTFYDIVNHPGGAVIIAINEQKQVCLITQGRPAVNSTIWELPAGCLEPGEAPLITAQRELEEETGWKAADWTELGSIVTTPGFCDEVLPLYAAQHLTRTQTNFDAEEQIEIHWLSMSQVEEMVADGTINDAKTLSLLYRLKQHPDFSKLWQE